MLAPSKGRALRALCLVIAVMTALLVGCGGSGPNNVYSSTDTSTAGTSSGGGTTPAVGAIQVVPTLAAKTAGKAMYPVPAEITQYRFRGFDDGNAIVFDTTVEKTTPVNLVNVPTKVTSLQYQLLDASGQVVGTGRFKVVVTANQTYVVIDPPFDVVVTGKNSLVSTSTYTLSGGDSGATVGGVVNGTLNFDGNGNVVGGQLVRQNATTVPPVAETFNVTGGTYSVAANRAFTANLTTDQYPLTMTGTVSLKPAGGAIYAAIYGSNGKNDALSACCTLQVNGSGFTASSLTGNLATVAFDVSALSGNLGWKTGSIVFDGAGKVTGGSITDASASSFAVQGGTYAVAANGNVTASITFARLGTIAFKGAVGADQVLSLAGVSSNNVDQIYLLASPKPAVPAVVNCPSVMEFIGMRSLDGGVKGQAAFNAGDNHLESGFFDDFAAITPPIATSRTTFQNGSFVLKQDATIEGSRTQQGDAPFLCIGGVFTTSQSVFFGALVRADGNALSSDQMLIILAK